MRWMRFAVMVWLATAAAAPPSAAQTAEPDVRIGWTAWADAEIVSKMAAIILRQGMGYDVELTLSDIGVQYRGVADGDLDAMLMSWQPGTHENYLQRYESTWTKKESLPPLLACIFARRW